MSGNSRDLGRGRIIPELPGSVSPFLSRSGWVSQVNNSRSPFHTLTVLNCTDLVPVEQLFKCSAVLACRSRDRYEETKFLCLTPLALLARRQVTAELRGCDRKRFSSAAFTKKGHVSPGWAGGGLTAKIVVMNRAQRCEIHNCAVCRWVEWELFSVLFLLLPF